VLPSSFGAPHAVVGGKRLLPADVRRVEGNFSRGDCVVICDEQGGEVGRGLVNYDARDALQIAGQKSRDIETLLGMPGRTAIIRRDDMVLKGD
jgi:glutamate 5-kinase